MLRHLVVLFVVLLGCGGGPRAGEDCSDLLMQANEISAVNCSNPSAPLQCCAPSAPCGSIPRNVWVDCPTCTVACN